MLDSIVIMGITVAAVEVIKSYMKKAKRRKLVQPFIIIAVGAGISILNAGVFGSGWGIETIREAAKTGINLSVYYAGIYSLGKSAVQVPDQK